MSEFSLLSLPNATRPRQSELTCGCRLWVVMVLTTASTAVNVWQALFHSLNQDRTEQRLFMEELCDSLPLLLIGLEGAIVQSFLATRVAKVSPLHSCVALPARTG